MAPFLARWASLSAKPFGFWLGLLLLAGCHDAARPAADERRVFRYNQPEALTSLDPAFARNQANWWAVGQLYSGLLELDSTLLPSPALARTFTISPDGRTYNFVLRRGVRFHDSEVFPGGQGREVTAADFVYSFKRILDPATASTGRFSARDTVSAAARRSSAQTVSGSRRCTPMICG